MKTQYPQVANIQNTTIMKLNILMLISLILILFVNCQKGSDDTIPKQTGNVKDIDGNTYSTVTIGSQTWMVENLKTTKYRDGSPIPNIIDNKQWSNLSTGAYCNYNNDLLFGNKYGKLYNWYAVNTEKLAPVGWHVPTDAEWTILENYIAINLGNSISLAKAIAAKTDWQLYGNPNPQKDQIDYDLTINNSSGFTALPAGQRDSHLGTFFSIRFDAFWWSTSENGYGGAWSRSISSSRGEIVRDYGADKERGFSVRCVKD